MYGNAGLLIRRGLYDKRHCIRRCCCCCCPAWRGFTNRGPYRTLPPIAKLLLIFAAAIAFAIALSFSIAAALTASAVAFDESVLDSCQQAWESAVAVVKTACCPAWITINTADLVCP
jgi:hypothetical protein